jgi:hypothetical protein
MGSGPSQPQKQQQEQLLKQELKQKQQKPAVQSEKTTTTTVGSATTAFLRPIRTVSTKVLTEEESKRILTVGKHRGI